MGWASGGEVFDPVARRVQQLGLPAAAKTEVLDVLVKALQDHGWDTEDESLGEFEDDEAIVEAFRRNDIIIQCGQEALVAGEAAWCTRERGGPGHQDGQHEDDWGRKWPAAKKALARDAGARRRSPRPARRCAPWSPSTSTATARASSS